MVKSRAEKTYYSEVDVLKGIAIFLVILGHSIIVFPINIKDNVLWCNILYNAIYSFHMPLFFLISGFCFSFRNGYKIFIKKKINRLLIPYVIFELFDALPRMLLPKLTNRVLDFSAIVNKMVFYGGEYWFLYTLFIIFMVFPLIHKLYQKTEYHIVVSVIFIGIVLSILPYMPNVFRLGTDLYHLIYFYIGYFIKQNFDELREYVNNNRWVLSKASLLLTCTLWIVLFGFTPYYNLLVALVACMFVFVLVKQFKTNIVSEYFRELGKYSLQLYLFNGFALGLSRACAVRITCIPMLIILFNMFVDCQLSYWWNKHVMAKWRLTRYIAGIV